MLTKVELTEMDQLATKVRLALGLDCDRNPDFDRAISLIKSFQETWKGTTVYGPDSDQDKSIDFLGLDTSTTSYLEDGGIQTIRELCALTTKELLTIRRIRAERVKEIDAVLTDHGYKRSNK